MSGSSPAVRLLLWAVAPAGPRVQPRSPGHWKSGQATGDHAVVEGELFDSRGQAHAREPRNELGEDGLQLDACQRRADAVARPVAEAEVRTPGPGRRLPWSRLVRAGPCVAGSHEGTELRDASAQRLRLSQDHPGDGGVGVRPGACGLGAGEEVDVPAGAVRCVTAVA